MLPDGHTTRAAGNTRPATRYPTPPVGHTTATALQAQVAALPPGVTQAQFDQEMLMLHNGLDYCTLNLPNYRSQQVGPLTITLSDPPTVADEQAIVDKLNQYITAWSTAG